MKTSPPPRLTSPSAVSDYVSLLFFSRPMSARWWCSIFLTCSSRISKFFPVFQMAFQNLRAGLRRFKCPWMIRSSPSSSSFSHCSNMFPRPSSSKSFSIDASIHLFALFSSSSSFLFRLPEQGSLLLLTFWPFCDAIMVSSLLPEQSMSKTYPSRNGGDTFCAKWNIFSSACVVCMVRGKEKDQNPGRHH